MEVYIYIANEDRRMGCQMAERYIWMDGWMEKRQTEMGEGIETRRESENEGKKCPESCDLRRLPLEREKTMKRCKHIPVMTIIIP